MTEETPLPHTLTVTLDNEPGALARIVGLFSARGYNIESLTVADISEQHDLSRITIVTLGTQHVIEQIMAQLEKLIPVHRVSDLTEAGNHVEREMALVKVTGKGEDRVEAMRLVVAHKRPGGLRRPGAWAFARDHQRGHAVFIEERHAADGRLPQQPLHRRRFTLLASETQQRSLALAP